MIIRDANKNELPYIRQQRVLAYQEYSSFISNNHWNGLKQIISSDSDEKPGVEVIVCELDGKIVGSVALFPPEKEAYEGKVDELYYPEIRLLAVDPSVRGKGIASRLITECINRTKNKGFAAIGLHTGEFMEKAIQLYERHGFKRIPEFDFVPADDGVVVKAFQLSL